MLNVNLTLPKLNQLATRFIGSGILASLGILLGLAPQATWKTSTSPQYYPKLTRSAIATAQEYTPEETANYAKAGFEVEMLRRQVYQEIKAIVNQPPGDIVCDRQETLSDLDPEVRELTESFCTRTIEIVQQNNLSVDRYNELKTQYDLRGEFYDRVQEILLRLQG